MAQAVEGAQELGLQLRACGLTPRALRAYEDSRLGRLQRVADLEWASLSHHRNLTVEVLCTLAVITFRQ